MTAKELSLFDCCEMNSNNKRTTESSNTDPKSSESRDDVEKPEETQY